MNYQVLSQKKIEETKLGPRFEIIVKTKSGTYRSTYVFHTATNDQPVQFLMHDDAILELHAQMTPEEIFKETWIYLESEGYDTSKPIM